MGKRARGSEARGQRSAGTDAGAAAGTNATIPGAATGGADPGGGAGGGAGRADGDGVAYHTRAGIQAGRNAATQGTAIKTRRGNGRHSAVSR
ncbi:MAG: hypothetical protein WC359_12660 [Dehalococcoidia bacterium]